MGLGQSVRSVVADSGCMALCGDGDKWWCGDEWLEGPGLQWGFGLAFYNVALPMNFFSGKHRLFNVEMPVLRIIQLSYP